MTTATWFMKRYWTQDGDLKTRAELSRPDTSQAEQWLTSDLFLCKGRLFRVLFGGSVISENDYGAQGRLFN